MGIVAQWSRVYSPAAPLSGNSLVTATAVLRHIRNCQIIIKLSMHVSLSVTKQYEFVSVNE